MDKKGGANFDGIPDRRLDGGMQRHSDFLRERKTNHEVRGKEKADAGGQESQNEDWKASPSQKVLIERARIHVAGSDHQGKLYEDEHGKFARDDSPKHDALQRSNTIGAMMGALSFDNQDTALNSATSQSARKRRPNDLVERNEPSAPKLAKMSSPFSSHQLPGVSRSFRNANIKSYPNLKNVSSTSAHHRQRSWPSRPIAHNARNTAPTVKAEQPPPESLTEPPPPNLRAARPNAAQIHPSSAYHNGQSRKSSNDSTPNIDNPHTSLALQPDSRIMPEGQLAAEIKAIYFGLVLIEAKCLGVVQAENERMEKNKGGKAPEWPALLALHRALLQEHHDFFLASQHPMSSPQLRGLANKYSMPARMWKHGIHSFLELLRHSLPNSMEYMQAFIILAYQMIALLYETVDNFKDTWIECLGDLARYRMAIEDTDPKDRETYTIVSRSWYSKASRRNVNIGRLYHHQAILARTQPLKQLSLYGRSLAAVQPFNSARESILTLFDPILFRTNLPAASSTSIDSPFIRLIAMLYTQRHLKEYYQSTLDLFIAQLDESINQAGYNWKIIGEYMAVILLASILTWGEQKGMHRVFTRKESTSISRDSSGVGAQSALEKGYREHQWSSRACKKRVAQEWHLLKEMLTIVLKRRDDDNVLPFIYVIVSFLWGLSSVHYGPEYLDDAFPWKQLSEYLNQLQQEEKQGDDKSVLLENVVLAEEQRMQGQAWAQKLFKPDPNPDTDSEEEDHQESASPLVPRAQKERILRLGKEIASKGAEYVPTGNRPWLSFNQSTEQFSERRPPSFSTSLEKIRDAARSAITNQDQAMTDVEEV